LSVYERIVIATIVGNSFGIGQSIAEYSILQEARKTGLTDVAVALALKKLSTKRLIEWNPVTGSMNEGDYLVYSLTDKGWQWVLDNENQFVLQRPEAEPEGNDIPF
jgi:DNA-binding PadR family transcriptional regulator